MTRRMIVVELAEVFHIHLDLAGIYNGYGVTQLYALNLFYGADHIGQLAYTGGLNDDPVRGISIQCFLQGLAKVTYQRAADAAGIHLGNVDAGILQETAVNTDLTEFVFNQHQLLTGVSLLQHFLNQGGLTGS